jgi:cardiolipin synthase (CMP-forming)
VALRSEFFTLPNAITGVRALGIPIFLYTYLVLNNVALSLIVLVVGAVSDYFDGKVARLLNQETALGAALDPAIDRAYILATILALLIKEKIPWWLVLVLIGRDLWLAALLLIRRALKQGVFEVTFLGKAATFNLLYAFPFFLVAGDSGLSGIFTIAGWTFAIWGVGLYLITGAQYTYIALREIAHKDIAEREI